MTEAQENELADMITDVAISYANGHAVDFRIAAKAAVAFVTDAEKLRARLRVACEELQNIADADIRNFVALNPEHEFRLWAQNRARYTLALTADLKEQQ